MTAPTGKLKFAYETIARLEAQRDALEAELTKAQFLVDQALHLQAEHYGDGMGLHLAMIKWARAANQSAPADKGQGEPVAFLPSEVELIAAGLGYPLSKEDAVQAYEASLQPRTDHSNNEDCEHCYGAGHDYNGDPCVGCCKPAAQPEQVAVVMPQDEKLMEIVERYPNGDPLEYDAALRQIKQ